MKVSEDFYNLMENERRKVSERIGGINVSIPNFTEMMVRSGIKFNTNVPVRRRKRYVN